MLRKALATLPATLDETYERILCSIKPSDSEYAIRILRWLVHARRPLTVDEISEVAALDPDREISFDVDEVLEDPLEIRNMCASLVTVVDIPVDPFKGILQKSTVVLLAHYSVQEYLTSDRISQGPADLYTIPDSTEEFIARSCIQYLFYCWNLATVVEQRIKHFKLVRYAMKYWIRHTPDGAEWLESTECLVTRFLITEVKAFKYTYTALMRNIMKKSDPRFKGVSPLYYASFYHHVQIVTLLLRYPETDLDETGDYVSCSALQAACHVGSKEIVKMLLDGGANINAQGGFYGNALQAACERGSKEIVELLLDGGANINAQGGSFETALQAACQRGSKEIVKMLLDRGADINVQGGHFGNALQATYFRNSTEIVKMLLDGGADLNIQGGWDGNALQAACERGSKEIVKMLLDGGANINAQGGSCHTALQAACQRGSTEIVKLLLDRGADINIQGGWYGNALQAACLRDSEEIVELLLDRGVDIHVQGGRFGSALQTACHRGLEETVQLFLDRGADVNTESEEYGTALQAACCGAYKEIIEMLLESGADVNAQGGTQKNALEVALKADDKEIIELLRAHGAQRVQCNDGPEEGSDKQAGLDVKDGSDSEERLRDE